MWFRDPGVRARQQQAIAIASDPAEYAERAGLTGEQAADLVAGFDGTLVFPSSPDYDKDRALQNPVFDLWPSMIAYCASIRDVATIVTAAQSAGATFRVRGGRHSTTGSCEADGEWVLDVSRLDGVAQTVPGQLVIGGGAPLGAMLSYMASHGIETVTGGCPSVGFSGFMQGGGYGFTSRQMGMSCDTVLRATLVLADGRLVTASEDENADLFYAIRGGAGGSFGVLVETTVSVIPAKAYQGLTLYWDIDDAPAVMHELQTNYMTHGHPDLGYQLLVCSWGATDVKKLVIPMMMSGGDLWAEIASLTAIGDPQVSWQGAGSYEQMNENLLSKLPSPPNPLHVTGPIYEDKRSGYLGTVLDESVWRSFFDYLATSPRPFDQIVLEPYGGDITTPPGRWGNAFDHRAVMCDLVLDVFWTDPADAPAAREFLDGFIDYGTGGGLATPHLTGAVYQNYPISGLPGWQGRYWDPATYAFLQQVKSKYDPSDVFRFPQSVRPVAVNTDDLDPERVPVAALTAPIS